MVEVLIAIFLTTTGILALLALQDPGWKNMAKADYTGRAAGILYKTLEINENRILNPCNTVTLGTNTEYVYPSGRATAISGDVTYTVETTIAVDCANASSYVITVKVTWPPINSTGITESMVVGRQEFYRFPSSCPDA